MKLRDIVSVLDSDEFYIQVGEKIEFVRIYDGDNLSDYLDLKVERIRPYQGGFDIDLVVG